MTCATASPSTPARLVPRRRGRPAAAAAAVDLPRARRPRSPPTGTCRPPPNCSPSPASGSNATAQRRPGDDRCSRPPLQAFFTDRLIRQRQASPHTVAAYRDTFRLLLAFAAAATGTQPSPLDLADLDAPLISAFLDHLETDRGNSVRTRNARLAAIHSLFRYAALRHPEHAAPSSASWPSRPNVPTARRHLPHRARDRTRCSPHRTATWTGRRDHALLPLAVQTGLRVSELTGLTCGLHLGAGAHVRCHGKGRKQRVTPLTPRPAGPARLARRAPRHQRPLFPTQRPSPQPRRRPPACPSTPPPRHGLPTIASKRSPRTSCGIMWTAGLCGRKRHLCW